MQSVGIYHGIRQDQAYIKPYALGGRISAQQTETELHKPLMHWEKSNNTLATDISATGHSRVVFRCFQAINAARSM